VRLKLPLGEALHGHHLHFCEAFRAVGQARSLTPAEAASDAPSNTFVPANMSQLCHELVCQGLRSLLLHERLEARVVEDRSIHGLTGWPSSLELDLAGAGCPRRFFFY